MQSVESKTTQEETERIVKADFKEVVGKVDNLSDKQKE